MPELAGAPLSVGPERRRRGPAAGHGRRGLCAGGHRAADLIAAGGFRLVADVAADRPAGLCRDAPAPPHHRAAPPADCKIVGTQLQPALTASSGPNILRRNVRPGQHAPPTAQTRNLLEYSPSRRHTQINRGSDHRLHPIARRMGQPDRGDRRVSPSMSCAR